jgi:hypothetical protein
MPVSNPVRSVDAALRHIATYQIASLAAASTYTVPVGGLLVYLDATDQNVRYRLDGNDPTAAIGSRVIADTGPVVLPLRQGQTISVIEEVAGATLDISVLGMTV